MSDLLERYLSAVRGQLPDDQKEDVTAELRDVLLSQVEDREAALGRRLTREETADLLKAFGHPLVVAGRYRRFNQLIGPEVFPFYWFGLKVFLSIALVLHVVLGALALAAAENPGQVFGQTVDRLFASAVMIVGWTTVIFVAIERTGVVGSLARWNPRHLPPAVARRRKSLFESALEIGMVVLFIAWWTGAASWADWWPDRERSVLVAAGPMREVLHWPVLALAVAALPISALDLVRPGWGRITAGLNIAWNAVALALLGLYLSARPVVEVTGTAPGEQLERVARGVELGVTLGLYALGLILVVEASKDAWWLVRGGRDRRPAAA